MSLALTILGNALPLIGVLLVGWDIYTLLVFYWCETLIIGFWTVVTIALHEGRQTWSGAGALGRGPTSTTSTAFVVLLHAGFFMAIHLFLMSSLYGDAWPGHLRSVGTFIDTFVIGQGLWPMLGGVFLQRALIFWEERQAPSISPAMVGFYLRIFVMQIVIIFGSLGVLLVGSGLFGLMLLVALKTLLDLYWSRIVAYAVARFVRAPDQ